MFAHIKEILKLGFPLSFARFCQNLGPFIAMLMVAHLGHAYVAAGALVSSIRITISIFVMSMIFATGVVSARLFGAKQYEDMGALLQHSWLLGLLISVPPMILFWYAAPILSLFHQPAALIPLTAEFFQPFAWSIPPLLLLISCQQFLFSQRKQHYVIWGSIFGVAAITFLGYALILGHWGCPKLGMRGMAYTFILQMCLNCLLYVLIFVLDKDMQKFKIFKLRLHHNWHHLKTLFQVGWPMSLQFGSELLGFSVMTILVGWLGENALAAQQVLMQYLLMIIVPVFGFAEAMGILISHAHGANLLHNIRRLGHAGILVVVCFCFIFLLLFFFCPDQLSRLYIHGNSPVALQTIHLLRPLFALTGFILLFDAASDIIFGALRGLFDTKIPMLISLGFTWVVSLPLSALFAFTLHGGMIGMRFASLIAIFAMLIVLLMRWHRKTAELVS